MNGDPSHGRPVYRCLGRDALSLVRCQRRGLASRIDKVVWDSIIEPFRSPRKLIGLVSDHFESMKAAIGDNGERDNLRRKLDALLAKEERAIALLLELPASSTVLTVQLQKIQAERVKLRVQLTGIEARQKQSNVAQESIQSMAEEISAVVRTLKANRQQFLQRVVERITFDGNEVVSTCFLAQNRSQRPNVVSTFERDALDNRIRFTVRALVA